MVLWESMMFFYGDIMGISWDQTSTTNIGMIGKSTRNRGVNTVLPLNSMGFPMKEVAVPVGDLNMSSTVG